MSRRARASLGVRSVEAGLEARPKGVVKTPAFDHPLRPRFRGRPLDLTPRSDTVYFGVTRVGTNPPALLPGGGRCARPPCFRRVLARLLSYWRWALGPRTAAAGGMRLRVWREDLALGRDGGPGRAFCACCGLRPMRWSADRASRWGGCSAMPVAAAPRWVGIAPAQARVYFMRSSGSAPGALALGKNSSRNCVVAAC